MEARHATLPYKISDEKALLDIEPISDWLSTTYWASERTKEMIIKSIENSLCFGLYSEDGQAGFVRVVSDYATISWVCDVFVDPGHRGKGLSKWLMEVMVEHPDIRHTSMILATRDAHGLYEQYGFTRREMMRRPVIEA
ncbi:GNAT family N-acetyltransferase [Brevibacillus sp. Leaf182]|uniref:GNAT family N-acetyltransferase n=1 Tax=Brevibacillus sp. Leaf182 TaxID=1736290 RepID=UPI0006F70D13|nr:GNAT family N-acetyltransferase [Brevibacillus sp. Leaf182]RAT97386.1 N-acetyltransferase [Brevibacillus sp. Leaf182]